MGKIISCVHHVNIAAPGKEKFEETIRFYSEILGLELIKKTETPTRCSAMLDTGSGIIEVNSAGTGEEKTGILNHIALATDDVYEAVRLVREAGYPIITEPKNGSAALTIAFCQGPCGERIEFFCEK